MALNRRLITYENDELNHLKVIAIFIFFIKNTSTLHKIVKWSEHSFAVWYKKVSSRFLYFHEKLRFKLLHKFTSQLINVALTDCQLQCIKTFR